ncbi:plexin-A4 [Elysia marginata]|uniref:Plexin-A4 n=1 Tax=Elysia marginata TaxID=1093978 RepID=A0AAV4GQ34_9GAST|nr:plexin-A4 [Elysia marginata]
MLSITRMFAWVLRRRCGLRKSCSRSDDVTAVRWLQGDSGQCIYIHRINPPSVSVNKAERLYITITPVSALPKSMSIHYSCVFKELNWSSPAELTFFGASCNTPKFQELGFNLGKLPHKTVTLALNSSETGKMFVTKRLNFYNCSNFNSCSKCTDSGFNCDWCVQDNGCYDDTRSCQANIVLGQKSLKSGVKGSKYCPKIDTRVTKEIYLPAGVKQEVLLKGSNIPDLDSKFKNYECVLEFNSRKMTVPAIRHDYKSITCNIPPINYDENQGSFEAKLSVYWGNNFWLESTSPLKATIYKCDILASNECSLCVNLNYTQNYLGCYWCQGSCRHSTSCERISSSTTCPAPLIKSVWPLSGPIRGGTNITIEGSNLGTKFEDIKNSVTVANVQCEPFRSLYMPSKRIVCETQWRDQEASGPVVITVNRRSGRFSTNFSFKTPRIEDIEPKIGPRSGGSVVTIKGREMNTGGTHRASIGGAPCNVIREKTTNSSIQCVTSKVCCSEAKHPITVYFDDNDYTLNRVFTYKDDPIITGITPLESILAGGRILTVLGKEFLAIQQPKMFAYIPTVRGNHYRTDATICKVISNTVMKCPTPPLVDSLKNIILSKRSAPGSMAYLVQEENAHAQSPVKPVQVKINNLVFYVGRVQYDVPQTYSFPREAIAGICVGGGILLLIIILILIIYRRKNTKAERIYRKLQIQLDSLESNVRNECKQAFAELQTDMTDLTEWRNGPTGPLLLNNLDIESYNKDGWRRLNTLALYRVHDGAYMSLLHRQGTLKSMNGSLDNSVLSIGSVSPILKKDEESGFKEWHLVKHDDTWVKDGGVKMISEIFLTRLLSTKGTLQKYIDDFFNNMLSVSPFVPPVVKYLFDFLDHEAEAHGILDHEVVHTWKCNSLPLRFWVNIIKNPDFVFDINKPRIVDSCLSVVAQTFMDSCSTSEHRLGKDSPSNKLLFAKDIAQYRKLVEKFFTEVREIQPLSEQEMNAFLAKISRTSPKLFYISSALGELYKYVSKYKNELMEVLELDNQAKAMQLSSKLGHVVTCMEGPSGNMAYV